MLGVKFLIDDLGRDIVTFARESAKQSTCPGEVAHKHPQTIGV